MALSDNDLFKDKPSQRRRAIDASHKHWSDSQKIEAVTTYLALGEVRLTAAVLKIPEVTLHNWRTKDWWKEIERELRVQEDLVLSARLQKIINKSLEQVEDRLSNGDYIYDQKTGALVRKPVNMKDAHKVSMDMIERRDILINKVPISQSVDAIEDKLTKLAEKFAQIANGVTKPTIEVTDVIIGEEVALHEEGEREVRSGLQEGERAIQLEAGADSEPHSPYNGPSSS